MEIIYTDSRGNRNTVTKIVSIDPTALKSSTTLGGTGARGGTRGTTTSSPFWTYFKWALVIAIIILVIFAHKKYKKEKMKNSDYTYGTLLKDSFETLRSKFQKSKSAKAKDNNDNHNNNKTINEKKSRK